ncbi:MAG: VOC family protein [Geitlerinemataceae cyanobacterium]|mgnify:CR=1 FL=1
MATQFKHVMLMVPDVEASVKFFSEGLGLDVKMSSPGWAELDADGTTIALHFARGKQEVSGSPILSFVVDDVRASVDALTKLGATLSGDIREPDFGTVAAMKTPEGHMVSLLQPKPAAVEA